MNRPISSVSDCLWPARFTEAQKERARYLVRPQPAPTASTYAAPTWPTVVCVTDGAVFLNDVDNQAALREMLVADMIARDEYGRTKYETPLTHDNGRDHLIDWYQEKLDGLVYAMNELKNGDKTGVAKRLFRQDLLAALDLRAAIAIRDGEKM